MSSNVSTRPDRSVVWTLGAILAVAAGVRVWGLGFGLPFGYARPDETYVMDVVRPLLLGQPPPPNYEYPWLYMALTALGWCGYYVVGAVQGTFGAFTEMPASWRDAPAPFFLINRGITAALGVATVWVLFQLGRRVGDARTGLIAAACLAVAYLHVRDSHYGTTDVPMSFFVTLTVLLILRAHERGDLRAFAWAGLAGGLAGATKYTAVFVVLPAAASAIIGALEEDRCRLRVLSGRLLAFAVPCGVVAALGIPFAVTDPGGFGRTLQLLFTSTSSGQAHLALEPGWITHLKYSLRYGLGLAILGGGVAGAALLAARSPRRAWLVWVFPVGYFAVVGAAGNQYFRYVVPLVPFFCLGTALAIDAAAGWVAARTAAPRQAWAMAAALLAALAVAEPAWRSIQFDRAMSAADNRVVVATWITERVPPGSSLLVTGSHYGHPWLPVERGYRFWTWDRREGRYWLPDDPDASRPDWILRQEHPLSADQPVVDEWLRDGYVVAWRFAAARPDDGGRRTFDRMDAFYLPYVGFTGVVRPGPNFTLFRRAAPEPVDRTVRR
ncbi:MAG: glycosyltransferase family 39 protein [Vicinamibacterales bacterium]